MKYRFILSGISFLFISISLFSQNQPNAVYKGVAEASSRISFQEMIQFEKQNGDIEFQQFKKPNNELYHPNFEIDAKSIIFQEPTKIGSETKSFMKDVSPQPDTSFQGLDDSGNSIPPDVNGAAGPNHLMVTLNTQVRIQDRVGGTISTISLGTFWNSLPGSGTFDPKVIYDIDADRWIFTTCAGSTPGDSRLYMGVSANNDPTGLWYLYSYVADPQNDVWFDYPSMGYNKKWIVVSGNMFGGGSYRTVYVFDKQAMFDGVASPQFTRFETSAGFTLVPAITYDTEEENIYLISSANGNQGGSGYISLFKVSGSLSDPQFSIIGNIGTPNPWAGNSGGSGDFLPQLGTTQTLNAVDHRMETVIFRNNKLWATHHIFLPANNPTRTAVQWWNITTTGEILQRGRIDDPTGVMSYAFASISVNSFEDMVIGHGIFSANQYASAGYSYRSHFDPINEIRTPFQYKDGLASYYKTFGGGRNRWGDYTATQLDPANGVDFWILQEYADTPLGGDRWGTWWAYLRIPFEPTPEFVSNETLIPLGESIDFSDKTVGIPQTWEWTFEGGEPSQSNLQNPEGITFSTEGSFDVTLTVSNTFGTNTIVKPNYITVSATILPEIAFSTDKQLVCTNEIVSFTDETNYMPRQWEWVFTPSTVTFVNGTNTFSQHPQVSFDGAGDYAVTLTASNLNGTSSSTLFDVVKVGGLDVPFTEYFQIETFADANWVIENPDNQKTWELTTVEGLTETDKAAKLDFLTYFSIGQRDRMITPPFNLLGYSQMQLTFKHAYAQRLAQLTDSLIIYISDNCGESWTRLYGNAENGSGNFATHPLSQGFVPVEASDWCGAGYGAGCISLDISNWVGKSDVRIAFETYSFYGNPLYVSNIQVGPTVGVSEEKPIESQLNIYPNPGNGTFRLKSQGGEAISDIIVYDITGKKVSEVKLLESGDVLHLEYLPKGMYYINAQLQNERTWSKILIEK